MPRRRARREGFSLIEVMIVIVILGILAAIAIPIFLKYTARVQSVEALSLVTAFKPAVTRYYARNQSFVGATNRKLGMPAPDGFSGRYVESVGVGNVTKQTLDITATFCHTGVNGCRVNEALSSQTLYLSAFIAKPGSSASIVWVCWVNDASQFPYIPSACRHTRRRP